jgi:translocation and assembly module TamB
VRRKLIILSLLLPLALMLAAAASLAWLLETEAGLHWVYAQLRPRIPGTLEIETLRGKLAGPIHASGLSYRDDFGTVQVDRALLDWSPGAVLLGRLQIDMLTADGIDVAINESARPSETRAGGFTFPLNVGVADSRLERIRIERAGREPVVVHAVRIAGLVSQDVVRLDRLRVDAQNFGVNVSGTIGINGGGDQGLQVEWHVEPPGRHPIRGSGEIAGNLTRLTLVQRITEPIDASIRAEIQKPLTDLHWRVNASAPEFDPARLGLAGPVTQAGVTFEATGGRTDFKAKGTLRAHARDLPALAGQFSLHGATSGDEVVLDKLVLNIPDTVAQLTAQATWRPRDATWKATARWQRLRWPLTGKVAVESPQGTLDANGTYQKYHVSTDFMTTAETYPGAHWHVAGHGNRDAIILDDVTVDAIGTTLQGTANVAWSPALRWTATVAARDINPAALWPEWPGSLALKANASGTRHVQRVNVQTLQGTLRGQPFQANASVVRRGPDFPHLSLKIAAGDANISINGGVERRWNVSWQFTAPDLGKLVAGSAGHVDSKGSIAGERSLPRVEAQLSGDGLAYDDTRVHETRLNATLDLSNAARSHAEVVATEGTFFGRVFDRIAIELDGYRADHTIDVDARLPEVTLRAVLHGDYADATWRGTIRQSTIGFENKVWSLREQPTLTVAKQHLALTQSCWRTDSAQVCVSLQRTAGAITTLSVTTRRLPLATLSPLFTNPPDWHGTLDGNADLRIDAGHLAHADARLEFSSGDITLSEARQTRFTYDGALWRLVVDDKGLRSNATITLPRGDGGSAELTLPQFHSDTALEHQPVEGRLAFTMRDLTPLAGVLPQLEALSGSLRMNFALAGTPADPRVRGKAELTNVAARIPATGVRVHNVHLAATASGGDELRLSGEAHSGPGRLNLTGRVTFPDEQAWRADVHIVGNQFHVVDLRETQVYVSPDLQAKLSPGEISVSGEVRLPNASFVVQSNKPDVVSTSPDVVVVNAPEGAPTPESPWKVTAQVRVILGDDVTFSGFGLNAHIAGEVTLIEAPGQATTARGEVRVVKGKYDAYGQKLDIERGRLVFVGGPVGNPGIDARAVRKIEEVTAGVEVKGTLQAPQLTLFSDPAMSQSDTLSYLLFGRPFEGASAEEGRSLATAARALKLAGGEQLARRIGSRFGIEEVDIETGSTNEAAALVLGKQLSPRLYINYSIGLFAPANVLHLKYKLGKHWSLEAQSGAQAGGDLIYTIER